MKRYDPKKALMELPKTRTFLQSEAARDLGVTINTIEQFESKLRNGDLTVSPVMVAYYFIRKEGK